MPVPFDSRSLYNFVVREFVRIENAHEFKGSIGGMSTGFYELDDKIDGIHPGDIVLVAGRPLMGKTDFIATLALQFAKKENPSTVSIFSLKLDPEKFCRRILAVASKIPMHRLLHGGMLMRDWEKLIRAVGFLSDLSLFVEADLCYSDDKILELVEIMGKDQGLSLVVIDGFEHLASSTNYAGRKAEIKAMIRSLRNIARNHRVPVIVTLIPSGGTDTGFDKRLAISDLDDLDLLVVDASDVTLFLHRPDVYSSDSAESGIAEIMVVKNNYGNTGPVKLAYLNEFRCFENLATGYNEDIPLEDY